MKCKQGCGTYDRTEQNRKEAEQVASFQGIMSVLMVVVLRPDLQKKIQNYLENRMNNQSEARTDIKSRRKFEPLRVPDLPQPVQPPHGLLRAKEIPHPINMGFAK